MLPPDFTEAVTRALQFAQQSAFRRDRSLCGLGDLLAALVKEDEGKAAILLEACGCSCRELRGQGAAPPLDPAACFLPFDEACEEAFFHARGFARELAGERTVASEHLLLAVLRQDRELRDRLTGLGLRFAELEQRILGEEAPALAMDEPLRIEDTSERMGTSRILDASANRAREALRVLEDHSRFATEDAYLCRELKTLRHELSEVIESISGNWLISARETQQDVGTRITTPREMARPSQREVVLANARRLQEALRSLEEFSKIEHPAQARKLEQIRYKAYTLERAMLLGASSRLRLQSARLYVLLAGEACAAALDWTIAEAATGGADMIQLREKTLNDRDLLARARQMRQWTRKSHILFIVNDRVDIAKLVDADGVHLGQDDLPVKDARRMLGPDALIGVSTHNVEQLRQAVRDGADYLGVGPTFASKTKQFAEFAGLSFVKEAHAETGLPMFVLGGITAETLPQAMAAGARRVAVSQAIASAEDPQQAARQLRQMLDQ